MEAEARACEALGVVFDTILFLTPLARKYYYDSVACAMASSGRTFEAGLAASCPCHFTFVLLQSRVNHVG
jgi:hypothetical protein